MATEQLPAMLRSLRQQAGLTQAQLAERLGIHGRYLANRSGNAAAGLSCRCRRSHFSGIWHLRQKLSDDHYSMVKTQKPPDSLNQGVLLVAGAGFEATTFGL